MQLLRLQVDLMHPHIFKCQKVVGDASKIDRPGIKTLKLKLCMEKNTGLCVVIDGTVIVRGADRGTPRVFRVENEIYRSIDQACSIPICSCSSSVVLCPDIDVYYWWWAGR